MITARPVKRTITSAVGHRQPPVIWSATTMIKFRQTVFLNIAAAAATLAFTQGGSVVPKLPHLEARDSNTPVVIAPARCSVARAGC